MPFIIALSARFLLPVVCLIAFTFRLLPSVQTFFPVLIQGTNQNYYVRAVNEMFPVFTGENVQARHKGLQRCRYIG